MAPSTKYQGACPSIHRCIFPTALRGREVLFSPFSPDGEMRHREKKSLVRSHPCSLCQSQRLNTNPLRCAKVSILPPYLSIASNLIFEQTQNKTQGAGTHPKLNARKFPQAPGSRVASSMWLSCHILMFLVSLFFLPK